MDTATTAAVSVEHETRRYAFTHSDPEDHIIREMARSGRFYEIELLETLRTHLSPGDVVLDIGANIGTHAVFFAGACRCRVTAFEPNPQAAEILYANIAANALDAAVDIRRIGLGRAGGAARMTNDATDNLGSNRLVLDAGGDQDAATVPVAALDEIEVPRPVRLVKIDVEGMETDVIAGARRLLEADRPIVCAEARTKEELERIRRGLDGLDYVVTETLNQTPTHVFIATSAADRNARMLEIVSRLASSLGIAEHRRDAGFQRVIGFLLDIDKRAQDTLDKSLDAQATSLREALGDDLGLLREALSEIRQAQAADSGDAEATRAALHEMLAPALSRTTGGMDRLTESIDGVVGSFKALSTELADDRARSAETINALSTEVQRLQRRLDGTGSKNQGDRADVPSVARSGAPMSICFYDVDFGDGWADWRPIEKVDLEDAGVAVLRQHRGEPGVTSPDLETPGYGLYDIELDADFDGRQATQLSLRIVADETNELLSCDYGLKLGRAQYKFYQPARVERVRIQVRARRPEPGFRVTLRRLRLSMVDPTDHQLHMCSRVGQPVIASMASIPSRRAMLRDAVYSLLPQCDIVRVFLNDYPDVPDFLNHPRVQVRRSQDFDDTGDAGKFGWIDEDDPPGYRIICDDDLLFPPDLVLRLTRKSREYEDRAMVGLHGVVLRQPITEYYDPDQRLAIHFQTPLPRTRQVHILATCVMCAHSKLLNIRRADFMFRNMADVWLAKHAQQNDIPLLIIDRRWKWVRENTQAEKYETIYENSLKRTRSAFDSSMLQNAVLRSLWPVRMRKLDRPIAAMVAIARSKEMLEAFRERFERTFGADYEWSLIIVLASDDAELRGYVQKATFATEYHIVDSQPWSAATISERLTALLSALEFELGAMADASVKLSSEDWWRLPKTENWLEEEAFLGFRVDDVGVGPEVGATGAPDFAVFSKRAVTERLGAFATPQPQKPLFSKRRSTMPSKLAERGARALFGAMTRDRDASSAALGVDQAPAAPAPRKLTFNGFFDRIVVLNLDRREDRWRAVSARLDALGIKAERFRAVDGSWPEVHRAFRDYAASPLKRLSPAIPSLRGVPEFYLSSTSQAQRIAYLEQRDGRKAIATRGAWGYLASMIGILEAAVRDEVETLLVMDDDVLFHRDAADLFAAAARGLPDDWLIFQLGALQYDWDSRWIRWRESNLYSQLGASIGSHAVGLRREILPFLLERSKRMDIPYDIGPLSAATHAFQDRNLVAFPNIVIQSITDSDINSSKFQEGSTRSKAYRTYRWIEADYPLEPT